MAGLLAIIVAVRHAAAEIGAQSNLLVTIALDVAVTLCGEIVIATAEPEGGKDKQYG